MAEQQTVVQSGNTRLYYSRGFRPDRAPEYLPCVVRGELTMSAGGDATPIYCPDPHRFNRFIQTAVVRGEIARATSNLTSRYPLRNISKLIEMSKDCEFVLLEIIGCDGANPQLYNDATKFIHFFNIIPTDYTSTASGAIGPDTRAVVDETLNFSANEVFESVPLQFSRVAHSETASDLAVGIAICDQRSCADCGDGTEIGCQYSFVALKLGTVIFTSDNWKTQETTTITGFDDEQMVATAVACSGNYVIVTHTGGTPVGGLYIANKSDTLNGTEEWTHLTVDFDTAVAIGKNFNDVSSFYNEAYIVCNDGYVVSFDSQFGVLRTVTNGVDTDADLTRIHTLKEGFWVAVGKNNATIGINTGKGEILYSTDGKTILQSASPTADDITSIFCVSEKVWLIGTAGGDLFYTIDMGASWGMSNYPKAGTGVINDIKFLNSSKGYFIWNSGTKGYIYRTIDGGYSWKVLPENKTIFPNNESLNRLATCSDDINLLMVCGVLDTTPSDKGIVIQGVG